MASPSQKSASPDPFELRAQLAGLGLQAEAYAGSRVVVVRVPHAEPSRFLRVILRDLDAVLRVEDEHGAILRQRTVEASSAVFVAHVVAGLCAETTCTTCGALAEPPAAWRFETPYCAGCDRAAEAYGRMHHPDAWEDSE